VRIRPSAVAGRFYPRDPAGLGRLVGTLLSGVDVPADDEPAAAYVVPHAGYRYSGPTAAHVYARLRRHADRVSRVVLVGPAHYVAVSGCAVPTTSEWATPLGTVPVSVELAGSLVTAGLVVADDRPHAPEHSLEVQVPFLQTVLPSGVPLLPVLVGQSTVDAVAAVLAASVESPGTVVLCSTDLSHYLDDASAREQDARTAQAILDLAPDRIGPRDACGRYALRGMLAWAGQRGLRPRLLDLSTSADTAGDATRVVGYPAFALLFSTEQGTAQR
jgi:AmmeMemoRadiSam system protein B